MRERSKAQVGRRLQSSKQKANATHAHTHTHDDVMANMLTIKSLRAPPPPNIPHTSARYVNHLMPERHPRNRSCAWSYCVRASRRFGGGSVAYIASCCVCVCVHHVHRPHSELSGRMCVRRCVLCTFVGVSVVRTSSPLCVKSVNMLVNLPHIRVHACVRALRA